MKIRELTKAEEQVMHILWEIREGFVKDILARFDDPKPAYNTVSTIIRILQEKGFVSHRAYGRTHQYYPLVSKEEYRGEHLSGFVRDYFSNSFEKMVSSFARDRKISTREMEEIMKIMESEIRKQKGSEK
jgi:predicted transcriptional regulator